MPEIESTKVASEPKDPATTVTHMMDEDTSEEKTHVPSQEQGKEQEQDPRDIRRKQVLMRNLLKTSQPS